MCKPEPPKGVKLEEFVETLITNAKKAEPGPHEGFGDPLTTLYDESTAARGWNCVEYSRAIVYAYRTKGYEMAYLLWTDDVGNTHLTPVRLDKPTVFEENTEHYWKLGLTPVSVFYHPPLHYNVVKLTEPLAKTIPILPLDHSIIKVAELGYGKVIDNPHCLDTGIARVYRVRVQGATGILVWHSEGTVHVISKDPWSILTHAHRLKAPDYGIDTFRY